MSYDYPITASYYAYRRRAGEEYPGVPQLEAGLTGEEITSILRRPNEKQGLTVLFVTRDPEIAQHTRRVIHLRDGQVESDKIVD
jgi:hypothetical protein